MPIIEQECNYLFLIGTNLSKIFLKMKKVKKNFQEVLVIILKHLWQQFLLGCT
jgi:glycerol-3-phosphate responsive antiterminator